ncbi:hypothetical protein [Streptomyces sp. NPDC001811]
MTVTPSSHTQPGLSMTFQGENWVGGLARAMVALRSHDDITLTKVAGMLGLRRLPATGVPTDAPAGSPMTTVSTGAVREPKLAPRPAVDGPNATVRREPAPPMPLLTPIGTEYAVQRLWTVPVLAETPAPTTSRRRTHESLLPPRSQAAILRLLLSRVVQEGPIDTERMITDLARGAYISELPRRPVRTLRFGVQILVDVGPGMQLFIRDQQELLRRIIAITGRHACDVRYFSANPLRAGREAGWSWKPLTAPPRGTRVLVLSDFGQHRARGEAVDVGTWQTATTIFHRGGCLPVALTPLPAQRQPSWLRSLMPVLTWDRTTTAAMAHARLG